MKRLLLAALLFHALSAWAAERVIATLTDPAGDDNGDGTLVYPQRGDFQPGDLDLTALKISRDGDLYRFEASFRNPVRNPSTAAAEGGAESMADFARLGFYTFNLDIYIDTDRLPGSGNTATLPGRKLRIDPSSAWEKAIVLTPRPGLLRGQLIDTLVETDTSRKRAEITASVDGSTYFVPRATVRGRSVTFEVPASFLGGGRPDTEWAITAVVTGAKLRIEADVSLFGQKGSALERLQLGVMQPAVGRPRDTFGYSGDYAPLPVVDLLSASPQQEVLTAKAAVAALPLSGGAATATARPAVPAAPPTSAAAGRPAPVQIIPPPSAAPAASPAAPPPAARTVPAPAAAAPAQAAPPPMQQLLQPERAAPTPSAAAKPSIADRLKALKDLLDQTLIDEAEYKQQRQRILNEL